jgi:hypothetical protein
MTAPGLRLHERTRPVRKASGAVHNAVLDIAGDFDLTHAETVGILLDIAASLHKYVLREERHPDNPDRKADEA